MMKKISLFALWGIMFFLGACTNEEIDAPQVLYQEEGLVSFKAGFHSSDSRTVLEEGGKVKWKAGDEIVLFNSSSSALYVAMADGSTTMFVLKDGETALNSKGTYTAFYPADAYDVSTRTFSVEQVQTAVAGTFDSSAALCMATVTNREDATFKNLCSLLKANIPQEAIDGNAVAMVLTSRMGSIISGGTLAQDGTIDWNLTASEYRLKGDFESDKDYYLVIPSQTFENGLTIAMKDSSDKTIENCARTKRTSVTFDGSKSYNMGTLYEEIAQDVDGMDDPDNGIVVLQEATKGNGVDIIVMGDGFASEHFLNGNYEKVMKDAAEAFFSIEPYTSLRDYFNVYYIKAVSEENHDAVPYYDYYGNQNGATMGDAVTKFSTELLPGSTYVTGNHSMVQEYMKQTIRYKGGKGGTPVSDENKVEQRAFTALALVQVNVKCYAGTCTMWYTNATDYCNALSIGYTTLGNDDTGTQCRLTTIHEAGGHGFGKLADEYQGQYFENFYTSTWTDLRTYHTWGVDRNVNEYWTDEDVLEWGGWDQWEHTTKDNVYWAELLRSEYDYTQTEGLSLYKGANTYYHMFCRATDNSVMNWQFGENGQSFNAISRWAIWYRIMKLAGATTAADFKSSLNEFITFDKAINGWGGHTAGAPTIGGENFVEKKLQPLAPPVIKRGEWINGRFVEME